MLDANGHSLAHTVAEQADTINQLVERVNDLTHLVQHQAHINEMLRSTLNALHEVDGELEARLNATQECLDRALYPHESHARPSSD
jgi:ABC-type transporter Mla subunit MlaD